MSISLNAASADSGKPLVHFWSECVGAGRAAEGLGASWQKQLGTVVESCGFRYLRFHGLFHDDMFVYRVVDGRAIYNFQYVDELFDRLLEIGIRPFVEFGFCPGDLATETGTVFWWKGNGSPPKDYRVWAELIGRTVRHWIARYGIEEVRTWYFEVWNEPNLWPFFRGTKSQYFELYRVTALAVKEIDSQLRVGGPATSNFVPDARFDGEKEDITCHKEVVDSNDLDSLNWRPVWVESFIAYCHELQLPVDFISAHPYPTDWALDEHGQGKRSTRGIGATPRDLALLRQIVDQSPYPNAEIHLTEWSSSSSPRDFTHDFLQAATYVLKTNLDSVGLVDSLSYWTFTDIFEESGAGDTIFHGGFGMINFQGINKPVFHAYRFLQGLGDEIVQRVESGIVTRHSVSGNLSALAWHYPPEMPLSVPASFDNDTIAREVLALGKAEKLQLAWTGLKPFSSIVVETLDQTHGNPVTAWHRMGRPESPSRAQMEWLREASETKKEFFQADASGAFSLDREITPWSIVSVRQS